jgi:hypothetical protein
MCLPDWMPVRKAPVRHAADQATAQAILLEPSIDPMALDGLHVRCL